MDMTFSTIRLRVVTSVFFLCQMHMRQRFAQWLTIQPHWRSCLLPTLRTFLDEFVCGCSSPQHQQNPLNFFQLWGGFSHLKNAASFKIFLILWTFAIAVQGPNHTNFQFHVSFCSELCIFSWCLKFFGFEHHDHNQFVLVKFGPQCLSQCCIGNGHHKHFHFSVWQRLCFAKLVLNVQWFGAAPTSSPTCSLCLSLSLSLSLGCKGFGRCVWWLSFSCCVVWYVLP